MPYRVGKLKKKEIFNLDGKSWSLPYDDEDVPHTRQSVIRSWLQDLYLRTDSFFPLEDYDAEWDTKEEGRAVMVMAASGNGAESRTVSCRTWRDGGCRHARRATPS